MYEARNYYVGGIPTRYISSIDASSSVVQLFLFFVLYWQP